jgi:hypothetical protein
MPSEIILSILELLQQQAFASFRRYCLEATTLPVDVHVIFSDILQGAGHIDDIFPYFLPNRSSLISTAWTT